MRAHQKTLAGILALVTGLVLCGVPQAAQALPQQASNPQNGQPDQQQGTIVNPAQGPLVPVPVPEENGTQNSSPPSENSGQQLPATPPPQSKSAEPEIQEPLGAATAEGVPAVGGAASRPAGEALAPAKQKQRRSLLLKMGLIAATGIAVGTVYALSKGTPSKPK
ncbi:MAG TPA: hypothetical protein VKV05_10065 [Terriglobales bacterium]|nr:hypothetical protein [Terriglobales bacterium]